MKSEESKSSLQSASRNGGRPSGRRRDTKTTYYIIAATLVIILVWYVLLVVLSRGPSYQCHWSPVDYLNVRVETTSDIEYEVYLPIPMDEPNQTWYLVDFLNLTRGNATWSIVSTSYGTALKVIGKGNITLRAEAPTSRYSYAGFSLSKYTWAGPELHGPFLVFVNASGSEDDLRHIYVGSGTSTPDGRPRTTVVQTIPGEVEPGWQEIVGGTGEPVC